MRKYRTDFSEDELKKALYASEQEAQSLIDNPDKWAQIKEYFDSAVDHIGDNCAVVLAGTKGDKVILMAAGTNKAVEAGFDANKIIKQIAPEIKGGGGGQPRMAQAGGKYVEGVPKALKIAEDMIK